MTRSAITLNFWNKRFIWYDLISATQGRNAPMRSKQPTYF